MPTQLHRHDEAGHIHVWTISAFRRLKFFHDDGMKHIVVDSLRLLQSKHRICMIGYVVMPEHVHVLLLPHAKGSNTPMPISMLLREFKQYVGFHGKARLRDVWRQKGQLWSQPLNDWALGRLGKQLIWNKRGYDRNIFSEHELHEKLIYCHKNPTTRELVATAEQWKWSSYRFYEMNDRSLIAMDWDGRWPIDW